MGTFTEYIATTDSNNSNHWLQWLFERSHIWLMMQNLIIKDLSLSVASVLDYRNVRCVSQSSCYLTRGGILTKKIKNCHSNALQCSRSSWGTVLFYQCLDKNSAIYILTYKIYVCYTCFTDHCPKLYNMPWYTWIIS